MIACGPRAEVGQRTASDRIQDPAQRKPTRGSGGQGGVLHLAPKEQPSERLVGALTWCPPEESNALRPGFRVVATLSETHVSLLSQITTTGGAMLFLAVSLEAMQGKSE